MIVTGSDGTRYRSTGRLADESTPHGTPTARRCENGEYCDDPVPDKTKPHFLVQMSQGIFWENVRRKPPGQQPTYEILEPLPRIPDWPLPGPAPQYLADHTSKAKVREGDTILVLTTDSYQAPCITVLTPRVQSGLLDGVEDYLDWGGRLGFDEEGVDDAHSTIQHEYGTEACVYLIARADPAEDA